MSQISCKLQVTCQREPGELHHSCTHYCEHVRCYGADNDYTMFGSNMLHLCERAQYIYYSFSCLIYVANRINKAMLSIIGGPRAFYNVRELYLGLGCDLKRSITLHTLSNVRLREQSEEFIKFTYEIIWNIKISK